MIRSKRHLCAMIAGLCAPAWIVPSVRAQSPFASGPVRLLATRSVLAATGVTLAPANPTIPETLTGPVIVDATIAADAARTHVVVLLGQSLIWKQMNTGVPLVMSASFRLTVTSNALPGGMLVLPLLISAIGEDYGNTPSTQSITHSVPFSRILTLDVDMLAINLAFASIGTSDAERRDIATQLMKSRMQIAVEPIVTVRSVQSVLFGRIHLLQVWGG